jgi:hypothetical protein
MPSFHVLVASIDRPTLQNLVNSIISQLDENDHLTIVYDNVQNPKPLDVSTALCSVHIYNEPVNLGCWGHGVRNKYRSILEETDFVMHGDDDDIYTEGTFDFLRNECTDLDTLYICKFGNGKGSYVFAENYDNIVCGKIGTPSGIIPFECNKNTEFGMYAGGDFTFYDKAKTRVNNVKFVDRFIYMTRPTY